MYLILCPIVIFSSILNDNWISEKHDRFSFHYQSADQQNRAEYVDFIDNGINSVNTFFGSAFKDQFDIYIHPNRQSLDSTWQKDWKMPEFKSECWMVASGVAMKLDVISPKMWDTEACEHKYADTDKTQNLMTHELFHVYHGQHNASPDFSNVEGIDWLVEGLATYASGQCDASRIEEVKKAIADHAVPNTLDNFWRGKLRYGLSGSMMMFIDQIYGRDKIIELLPLTKKSEVLNSLSTTEQQLLDDWKKHFNQ